MTRDIRLLFGPLAAVIFLVGVAALARALPGYDHMHQTISEIGAVGSPVQLPFTLLLCAVAACLTVFALGVRAASVRAGHNSMAAWLIAALAVSAAGVGIFSTPHPLHNVFGLSELVGYQAPLALALAWRRDARAKALVGVSWIFFVLVWIGIGLNLSGLQPDGAVWNAVKPVYGLVQRALFAAWFGWAFVAGLMLRRSEVRRA